MVLAARTLVPPTSAMSVGQDQVEVLYDYSYSDENGEVEIRTGEVYRLLEKTNNEWWHVCDASKTEPYKEEDGIYVPAQYVRILKEAKDTEVDSAISSLDDMLLNEEEQEALGHQNSSVSPSVPRQELGSFRSSGSISDRPPSNHSMNGMGKGPYVDEGDYVNLDQYRLDANITSIKPSSTDAPIDESDYANLPFLEQQSLQQQHTDPHHNLEGPHLKDGTYVRVLVDGLPWDIYEDPATKRKFFHNRETGELTWKPPRKDKPSSPVEHHSPRPNFPPPVAPKKGREPSSPSPVFLDSLHPLQEHQSSGGDVYEKKVDESGDVFYIHKITREEWQEHVDESGRQYFHRLGSNDTQWELPYLRTKSESREPSPHEGERMGSGGASASGTSTMSLTRQSKARSMYGKLSSATPDQASFKAGTLPPNFSPGPGMEKSPSLPSFQLQPPTPHSSAPYRFEDQLSGYLQKTKIADMGRKKVKKSWGQAYVVLLGSNLVFYKDQKAAERKAGSPHGRPDGVLSLQGAHVDFNPSKDITGSSRKNTILISGSTGSQFLLQSDDEKKIHEWLFRLKVVANDLTEEQASAVREQEHGGSGKSAAASVGLGRSLSTTSDDSGTDRGNWSGIRAKLLNFINRRPLQEDLVKRGIIKDAVFGSTLQAVCDRDKCSVPNFILECITAVEAKGLEQDGLYRVSGNMAEIQRLRYVVDKDDHYNLTEDQWDIHTLTGALKLFFRELREPLFPLKCVDKFVEASKKESKKDKLKAFKEALSTLPKCNYETLRVLFQHLNNLIQFSQQNRMHVQNVAIVFGPTLMSAEGDFANMAARTMYHSKVVEFLLLEYDNLFR